MTVHFLEREFYPLFMVGSLLLAGTKSFAMLCLPNPLALTAFLISTDLLESSDARSSRHIPRDLLPLLSEKPVRIDC